MAGIVARLRLGPYAPVTSSPGGPFLTSGAGSFLASGEGENPFAALGVMLAGALAGPMVDMMLTPESLTAMARGARPAAGRNAKGGTATLDNFKGKYEAWNRFVVTVPEDEGKTSVAFVFTRERFTEWKLTALRLPDDWAQ